MNTTPAWLPPAWLRLVGFGPVPVRATLLGCWAAAALSGACSSGTEGDRPTDQAGPRTEAPRAMGGHDDGDDPARPGHDHGEDPSPTPSASEADDRRVLEARGVVTRVEQAEGRVTIDHEAVGDYMPAMTMPFYAGDPDLLDGLAPGDQVTFAFEKPDRGPRHELLRITKEPAADD